MNVLILGGGVAGLFAARSLADRGHTVTLVERDRLLGNAREVGVSQQSQAHVFMRRGFDALTTILPGFAAQLHALGATKAEIGSEWAFQFQQGWFVRSPADIEIYSCSRTFFEDALRQFVFSKPGITLQSSFRVLYVSLGDSSSPTVTLENSVSRERTQVTADLMIDCLGSGSKAPEWLEQSGYGTVPADKNSTFLGYATGVFSNVKMPPNTKAILSAPQAPHQPRAGMVMAIEHGLYQSTMNGYSKDYPPTDHGAFLSFAKTLRTPAIFTAIQSAHLEGSIKAYRKDHNEFRRFDKMARWPRGFLAIGDSVASQNPIYGQGMACAAMAVESIIKAGLTAAAVQGVQTKIQAIYATPWTNATLEDARWPMTTGANKVPLLNALTDRFMVGATKDARLAHSFLRQLHMLDGPSAILAPGVLGGILLKGGGGAQPGTVPMPEYAPPP